MYFSIKVHKNNKFAYNPNKEQNTDEVEHFMFLKNLNIYLRNVKHQHLLKLIIVLDLRKRLFLKNSANHSGLHALILNP